MKGPADILRDAAKLLTDERWTRGIMSKSKTGGEVYPDSEAACKWCADGALKKLAANDPTVYDTARFYLGQAALAHGFEEPEDFNDAPSTTAAKVRALLLEAADLCDQEE